MLSNVVRIEGLTLNTKHLKAMLSNVVRIEGLTLNTQYKPHSRALPSLIYTNTSLQSNHYDNPTGYTFPSQYH